MKSLAVLLLFAAPAFGSTPEHFFDSLALHPNVPQLPVATVSPPPVLTPIDPTSTMAMIAAIQANGDAQWTWMRDSLVKVGDKVDKIAADEADEVGKMLNISNDLGALHTQVAAIPAGPPGVDGIPGPRGIPGIPGVSPTIQIGTVVSVPCSTPASVTNTGTATAAIFNFFIPQCGTTPPVTGGGPYALSFSANATRAGAVNLSGATVKGVVYVFTATVADATNMNPAGVTSVCYWLDPPRDTAGVVNLSGPPRTCEGGAPWDFAGSATATTANPWNSATVANGLHTIVQKVAPSGEINTAPFTVAN